MKKIVYKELTVFLGVGLTAVGIDFVSYKILVLLTGSFDISKCISFVVGAIFAYFANRAWTFGHVQRQPDSWYRFVVLYMFALAANVLVNRFALSMLADYAWRVRGAFILATGVSAAINFIGMKLFVFSHRKQVVP
jgi:putative flippase GtrA